MSPLILTPGFGDDAPTASLYYGQDVRDSLRLLPDASVHTVCTSPPYFGLRDYGTGDAQIGLEPTPDEFVGALVEVFREIKRVLRPDGTLWVNLGDSYWTAKGTPGGEHCWTLGVNSDPKNRARRFGKRPQDGPPPAGIKPKDIIGIPWRVAFALQADGWYLRQDIIWSKNNPMPESVRDRCTKSHEYVFLLAHPASKGRYYYDADAICVQAHGNPSSVARRGRADHTSVGTTSLYGSKYGQSGHGKNSDYRGGTRNKRSVWSVNLKPYRGAHFACWPPDLVRPMILAGCPVGGVVLDPFSGSATTGMVALQEGRHYIGIDLNPDYLDLAQARIEGRKAPQKPEPDSEPDIFDLFGGDA